MAETQPLSATPCGISPSEDDLGRSGALASGGHDPIGRTLGGEQPGGPEDRSGSLPPGLVGLQTSHASQTNRIEITGENPFRTLAKGARIRRLKLTVGAFVDQVRDALAAGGRRVDLIMVTLTYSADWLYDRRQVSGYVQRQSEWLKRRGIQHGVCWVLELQKRGTPHYHVLWVVPRGTRLPKPDQVEGKRRRTLLWPYGSSRIELARKPAYLVKYASKFDLGCELPRGARLFGVGGTERSWRARAVWRALPKYVRTQTSPGDRVRRAAGGGWVNLDTGALYPSQWRFSFQRAGPLWTVVLQRIQTGP